MNLDMEMGVAMEPVRSAGAGMQKQPKIIDKVEREKKRRRNLKHDLLPLEPFYHSTGTTRNCV